MKRYHLFRKPCLQEDEGRRHFIGDYKSKKEAKAARRSQTADGYFRKSDFIIVKG